MDKGTVHIYCGKGKGKTTAAIGQAIKAACEGRNVVIIEFLKAKEEDELGFPQASGAGNQGFPF